MSLVACTYILELGCIAAPSWAHIHQTTQRYKESGDLVKGVALELDTSQTHGATKGAQAGADDEDQQQRSRPQDSSARRTHKRGYAAAQTPSQAS